MANENKELTQSPNLWMQLEAKYNRRGPKDIGPPPVVTKIQEGCPLLIPPRAIIKILQAVPDILPPDLPDLEEQHLSPAQKRFVENLREKYPTIANVLLVIPPVIKTGKEALDEPPRLNGF